MTVTQFWNAVIGIALVCVGAAIVAAVAYYLYVPQVPPQQQEHDGQTRTFSCPEMGFVVLELDEQSRRITFSDGRVVEVSWTPTAPRNEAEARWKRFVTDDGTLVFWEAADEALIEEEGQILLRECYILA